MSLRRFVLVAFIPLLLLAPPAMAWGPLGHRVVAELAWRQLTPEARAEVRRLLAVRHAHALADIATWPDDIRHERAYKTLWQATRKQHYVNFGDSDCHYDPPRDCRDGKCVVEGIRHYEARLADHGLPDAERLEALAFVVHFIGDVHQPLHAGYRRDAGGNGYQVQFEGKGSNLHRVWDSGMLRTRHLRWKKYADFLAGEGAVTTPGDATGRAAPVRWAEESCRITRGIYPSGHKIGKDYVQRELPVADKRLRMAGKRLADVLNDLLG